MEADAVAAIFADHQSAEAAVNKLADGTVDEIVRAKAILGTASPTRLDEFTGLKTEDREDVGTLDAS